MTSYIHDAKSNNVVGEHLRRSAEGIKIIHDAVDEDTEFKLAREAIHSAKRIYFLGFGYDETNVRRLNLGRVRNAEVKGTCLTLGKVQRKLAHDELCSGMESIQQSRVTLHKFDVLRFLKEEGELT